MDHFSLLSKDFLEQAYKQYDTIIFQGQWTSDHKQIIIVDKDSSHGLDAIVGHHLEQGKHILLILTTAWVDEVLSIMEWANQITIINTHAGLGSFEATGKRDTWDISKTMSYGFDVYDPHTTKELSKEILGASGKVYIRTNTHLLSAENYPVLKWEWAKKMLFSLQWQGFSGGHWTIIWLWSSIVDIFHTGVLLQEAGESMDCFITSAVDVAFSENLINSIRESESLWIVADQHNNQLWETSLKAKLWDLGLFETEIKFISPRLEKITSFLPEYIYEQSEMDGQWIAKRILGK